jgi:3-dehydroquinate synthetase
MVLEATLGQSLGITEATTISRLSAALEQHGLPTGLPHNIPGAALFEAMRHDKKNRAHSLRFTLLKRIGEVARPSGGEWTFEVTQNELRKCLRLVP